jgi:hypothetical protein
MRAAVLIVAISVLKRENSKSKAQIGNCHLMLDGRILMLMVFFMK